MPCALASGTLIGWSCSPHSGQPPCFPYFRARPAISTKRRNHSHSATEEAREGREGDSRADRRGSPGKRLCDRRNRRNVAIVS